MRAFLGSRCQTFLIKTLCACELVATQERIANGKIAHGEQMIFSVVGQQLGGDGVRPFLIIVIHRELDRNGIGGDLLIWVTGLLRGESIEGDAKIGGTC